MLHLPAASAFAPVASAGLSSAGGAVLVGVGAIGAIGAIGADALVVVVVAPGAAFFGAAFAFFGPAAAAAFGSETSRARATADAREMTFMARAPCAGKSALA